MNKIKVAIIGARGYTGRELIRYLLRHPKVEISLLFAQKLGKPIAVSSALPEFRNVLDIAIEKFHTNKIKNIDVVFLALPPTQSMKIVPQLQDKVKLIVDLSADYRFKNLSLYEYVYNVKHSDPKNCRNAVYGLSEVFRSSIKKAKLIANPGCYSTSFLLPLYPLAEKSQLDNVEIIVDAKSGVSGAGRKSDLAYLFCELNENVRPYNINIHRHQFEALDVLRRAKVKNISLTLVPQIIPLNRGIISMIYLFFKEKPRIDIYKLIKRYYRNEIFVRILNKGTIPELKNTSYTNFIDLGFFDYISRDVYLIISCLDNLGKGAAGQAIQNMNIALGLEESLGLL